MFPFIGSSEMLIWSHIMLNFETYVMRHGEYGAQALVEQIERISDIRLNKEAPLPLEVRWHIVMQKPLPQQQSMAA
jgi:hypothetical protein